MTLHAKSTSIDVGLRALVAETLAAMTKLKGAVQLVAGFAAKRWKGHRR